MNANISKSLPIGRNQRGQTLIVAILILGILLIIGFVFLGIINRNIGQASRAQQRSLATDLAEAGIRYAHSQLLNSELGADWRPALTPPAGGRDPDTDLLQPGGLDGLGAFTRVTFDSGRALVRVRYGPSDANIFQANPGGALREPGKARNYLIIEAYGRPGRVTQSDPTTLSNSDRRESRKLIAFCSIGMLEQARFITNKDSVSRPAEIGVPTENPARFGLVPVNVPIQIGDQFIGNAGQPIHGGGGLYSNADIVVHGVVKAVMNGLYGDGWVIDGTIVGADGNARLQVDRYDGSGNAFHELIVGNGVGSYDGANAPYRLPSRDPNFTTLRGMIRDGYAGADQETWTRYGGRKEPPSILRLDPDTNVNRYVALSRDSGFLGNRGNTGRWGQGRNIYVNNTADLQLRPDEDSREDVGSEESLFYDWLNPNNGQVQGSGWQGPFYVPPGAFVQLDSAGATIIRDARSPQNLRTWRRPDGTDSGLSALRYRFGLGTDNLVHVVNTLTPGVNINGLLTAVDYQRGFPFDGVLFFEGNVRVRGVIPTDVQLTLVSLGSIYIEGSITKGVMTSNGTRINRQSRSALALLARQYVVLNTTQFFGPGTNHVEPVSDVPGAISMNPVKMGAADGNMTLRAELPLDPTTGANPSVWSTYAENYKQFADPNGNNGAPIDMRLMVSHSMFAGSGANAFIAMDINYGLSATPAYRFALSPFNAATPFFPTGTNNAPIYGLGTETWQQYAKFETTGFPILRQGAYTVSPTALTATGNEGAYSLLIAETGNFDFHSTNIGFPSTNDYAMARAAIVPHDVRIEAAIFAEEGSFFVIPGQWFNPNPNDRRDFYQGLGATQAERDQARLENFGAFPETPFYGEPADVKVTVVGSISENMPPPISQQAEWLRKWGWIPREHGASGELIPFSHVPTGFNILTQDQYVPNLTLVYDSYLATGRTGGFDPASPYVRTDADNRPLAPLPRLPVSPSLAYFGEVNP